METFSFIIYAHFNLEVYFKRSLLVLISIIVYSYIPAQNYALQFDGVDDYIAIPYNHFIDTANIFDIVTAFTVECWVKPDGLSRNEIPIVGKYEADYTKGWGIFYHGYSSTFGISISDGATYFRLLARKNLCTPDQFYHLAGVYNKITGEVKLYVNGILEVDHKGFYEGAIHSKRPLEIGKYAYADRPDSLKSFSGAIDEVRLWNYARSAAQINRNLYFELRGNEAGLAAYYNFNQKPPCGEGALEKHTLLDLSGNRRLGVFNNFDWKDHLKENCRRPWITDSPAGIRCMVQDEKGFLWLGTETGLLKYDGYSYRAYWPKQKGNYRVQNLLLGKNTDLFVETPEGFYRFDLKTERFILLDRKRKAASYGGIALDKAGDLWVVRSFGLEKFRLDEKTLKKGNKKYLRDTLYSSLGINAIFFDRQNRLWIGTSNGLKTAGILENKSLKKLRLSPTQVAVQGKKLEWRINAIAESGKGLWLMGVGSTGDGEEQIIGRLNPETGEFTLLKMESLFAEYIPEQAKGSEKEHIGFLLEDSNGLLWLADEKRLYQISFPLNETETRLWPHPFPAARTIFEDHSGTIWAGSDHNLYTTHPLNWRFHFKALPPYPGKDYVPTSAILKDKLGRIWIGTWGEGIYRYDPIKNAFIHFEYEESNRPSPNFVEAIMEDSQGVVWVAATREISRWNESAGVLTPFKFDDLNIEPSWYAPVLRNYNDIAETQDGVLWFATHLGLARYERKKEKVKYFFLPGADKKDARNPINRFKRIYEDRVGALWTIAGDSENPFLAIPRQQENGELDYEYRQQPDKRKHGLSSIISMHQDRNGKYWFGTRGEENQGLIFYDPEQDSSRMFMKIDGLISNWIYAVEEDHAGGLWLATPKGLSNWDLKEQKFINYGEETGLILPKGIPGKASIFKTREGAFLVCGLNGFYRFHPDSLRKEYLPPKAAVVGLHIAGTPLFRDSIAPVLSYTKELVLKHDQQDLTFTFAALQFENWEKSRCRYRMRGLEEEWQETGFDRQARYAYLPPGKYTLESQAAASNAQWGEPAYLSIKVLPSWYQSKLAYLTYFLLAVGLFYLWRQLELNRLKLRQEIAMQKFKATQLEEADRVKTRFYTNISHEFRTPMTVVLGMADQILRQSNKKQKEAARLIKRNGQMVLHLINQMLDLARLEAGRLNFNIVQDDVVVYLRYLCQSFRPYAHTQKQQLNFFSEMESLVMDYDPDKLLVVVSNLVSNAIKHTAPGGEISLTLKTRSLKQVNDFASKFLEIIVSDTGSGIDKADLPHVFDRFYQAKSGADRKFSKTSEGTGLGLALTKELVEKLEGKIWVESILGQGATFIVLLPVVNRARRQPVISEGLDLKDRIVPFIPGKSKEIVKTDADSSGEKNFFPYGKRPPELLIIEDSIDVIAYIKICLRGKYQISIAENGRDGLEKAMKTLPDLIISDVMLPGKDGFEICKALKNYELTSHIPIILLTARAGFQNRLAGLKRGADAYLTKPFQPEELLVELEKLIGLRKRLQKRYQTLARSALITDPLFLAEDAFLKKVNRQIERRLHDERFWYLELAKALKVSKSKLDRKIKQLTGKSLNEYIHFYRLHRAKDFLKQGDWNVTEVSQKTGYANHAYFTKKFGELFGRPPSSFLP